MSSPGTSPDHRPSERPLANPTPILILGAVGLAAIGGVVFSLFHAPALPAVVADDYRRVAGAALIPEIATNDAERLSGELHARQPTFDVRIPSLDGVGYGLAGGSVRPIGRRPGLVAVYRNRLMDLVVFHAFEGQLSELPPTSETREVDGWRFLVYRKSTNVLVFWQQGAAVMVITSSLPAEQVIAVARSAGDSIRQRSTQ